MKNVYFKNRKEWRDWLKQNHDKSNGIWLIFYKKHTEKISLAYEDAVKEALCFGWIDSIVRRIDDEKFARKITPRKAKSNWSKLNKKRADQLIEDGLMTEFGMTKINEAKTTGYWEKSLIYEPITEFPEIFRKALDKNQKANDNFNKLAPSYQKHYIGWIASAKRQTTKERRVQESISLLEKGEKLGMK